MITPTRRLVALAASGALLVLPLASVSAQAHAAPKPKSYANCTALNKVYPHGVGRKGAKDKTSGKRVTTFRVDTKLYELNNGPRNKKTGEYDLDRDNDGIACEKR